MATFLETKPRRLEPKPQGVTLIMEFSNASIFHSGVKLHRLKRGIAWPCMNFSQMSMLGEKRALEHQQHYLGCKLVCMDGWAIKATLRFNS